MAWWKAKKEKAVRTSVNPNDKEGYENLRDMNRHYTTEVPIWLNGRKAIAETGPLDIISYKYEEEQS